MKRKSLQERDCEKRLQEILHYYFGDRYEAEFASERKADRRILPVAGDISRKDLAECLPGDVQTVIHTAATVRVKAALEFGLISDYLMSLYSEFSPVDLTAEGILKIAQYADRQTVFHLNSNRPVYFDRLLQVLHELGIPMEVVDKETFCEALQRTIRESGREYIFEAFQNDMDEQGRLVYDSNIRIENEFTVWFLKKVVFEWNETDTEYIRGYLEYFRGIGYLKR